MTKKDALYIAGPTIIQSLLYFGVKLICGSPNLLISTFDNHLPFVSYFVYFYVFWYVMLIFVPYLIYRYDKELLRKYNKIFILDSVICILIFLIYPTTIHRASFDVNSLSTWIVNLIYYFDTPVLNCFPSLHALNSLLWIIVMLNNKKIPKLWRGIIIFLSTGVILSTIFIKQHVIYDLIGSVGVLIISYLILKIISLIRKK